MTGRVELQNRELAQVSGGGFWSDLMDIGEEVVKVATTGVPGIVYDALSGGDDGGGVAVAVSSGDPGSTQTTPVPQPQYNQNNNNNSGAQQNSQKNNNYNTGGLNVTR